jgi:hypothetical protein
MDEQAKKPKKPKTMVERVNNALAIGVMLALGVPALVCDGVFLGMLAEGCLTLWSDYTPTPYPLRLTGQSFINYAAWGWGCALAVASVPAAIYMACLAWARRIDARRPDPFDDL